MLRVATWELAAHLNSRRVLAMAGVILLLFPLVAVLRVTEFSRAAEDFRQRLAAQEECLARYAHVNRLGAMVSLILPPRAMDALFAPPPVSVAQQEEAEPLEADSLRGFIDEIGLEFLVSFVLGPWLLLVGVSRAAGDRQAGRLAELAALPVGRATLVAGRIMADVMLVGILLLVGLAFSVAIVAVHPATRLAPADLVALVLVYGVSLLYLLLAAAVGHAIGIGARTAATATLAAVSLWILVEVVVPMGAPLAVEAFDRLPDEASIEARIRESFQQERQEEIRRALRQLKKGAGFEERNRVVEEINRRYRERVRRMRADFERRKQRHARLVRAAAGVSPGAACRMAAWELAGVGRAWAAHASSVIDAWASETREYVETRVAEAARNQGFSVESLLRLDGLPRLRLREVPLGHRLRAARWLLAWLLIVAGAGCCWVVVRAVRVDPRPAS